MFDQKTQPALSTSSTREGITEKRTIIGQSKSGADVFGTAVLPLPVSENDPHQSLPVPQRKIVEKVLLSGTYSDLFEAERELVKLGGIDSVRALACLLSEVVTDQGKLTNISLGGRHVPVYTAHTIK